MTQRLKRVNEKMIQNGINCSNNQHTPQNTCSASINFTQPLTNRTAIREKRRQNRESQLTTRDEMRDLGKGHRDPRTTGEPELSPKIVETSSNHNL